MVVEGRSASPADVDSLYGSFVAHYGEHIPASIRADIAVEPTRSESITTRKAEGDGATATRQRTDA